MKPSVPRGLVNQPTMSPLGLIPVACALTAPGGLSLTKWTGVDAELERDVCAGAVYVKADGDVGIIQSEYLGNRVPAMALIGVSKERPDIVLFDKAPDTIEFFSADYISKDRFSYEGRYGDIPAISVIPVIVPAIRRNGDVIDTGVTPCADELAAYALRFTYTDKPVVSWMFGVIERTAPEPRRTANEMRADLRGRQQLRCCRRRLWPATRAECHERSRQPESQRSNSEVHGPVLSQTQTLMRKHGFTRG